MLRKMEEPIKRIEHYVVVQNLAVNGMWGVQSDNARI